MDSFPTPKVSKQARSYGVRENLDAFSKRTSDQRSFQLDKTSKGMGSNHKEILKEESP
jgi:hypothetical protein